MVIVVLIQRKKQINVMHSKRMASCLLYYQSRGANVTRGLNYLKAAGKGGSKKAFIATYQLGHRAHFGIGESQNLSKAATWMLKSYEAVKKEKTKN